MVEATIFSSVIGPAFFPAIISALAAIIAAVIGMINRRHIREVHMTVNGNMREMTANLAKALEQVSNLKQEVIYEKTQPAEAPNDSTPDHAHDVD